MSTTITHAGGTIVPTALDGFDPSRESGNAVHWIPGNPNPDVTFGPAKLRTGTLRLVFDNEADMIDAVDAHATGTTFAIANTDLDSIAMTYIVNGRITPGLSPARLSWTVSVDYQEVSP